MNLWSKHYSTSTYFIKIWVASKYTQLLVWIPPKYSLMYEAIASVSQMHASRLQMLATHSQPLLAPDRKCLAHFPVPPAWSKRPRSYVDGIWVWSQVMFPYAHLCLELEGLIWSTRICPGRHIAISVLNLTVASVLSTFSISKALGKYGGLIEPSVQYISGISFRVLVERS